MLTAEVAEVFPNKTKPRYTQVAQRHGRITLVGFGPRALYRQLKRKPSVPLLYALHRGFNLTGAELGTVVTRMKGAPQ